MGFYRTDANHVFSDKLACRENLVLKFFKLPSKIDVLNLYVENRLSNNLFSPIKLCEVPCSCSMNPTR